MTSGRLDSVLHPLFDVLASHKREITVPSEMVISSLGKRRRSRLPANKRPFEAARAPSAWTDGTRRGS